MPTHHRTIKVKDWEKYAQGEESEEMKELAADLEKDMEDIFGVEKPKERFMTGPHGEKRPTSSMSSLVQAFEVATGQREEEYVDGRKPPPKKKVRII